MENILYHEQWNEIPIVQSKDNIQIHFLIIRVQTKIFSSIEIFYLYFDNTEKLHIFIFPAPNEY